MVDETAKRSGPSARNVSSAGSVSAQDFDTHDAYFRDSFPFRPYANRRAFYEDYEPAYRLGFDAHSRFENLSFDEIEPQLEAEWYAIQPSTALTWQQVKPAARDAWQRSEELRPDDLGRAGNRPFRWTARSEPERSR